MRIWLGLGVALLVGCGSAQKKTPANGANGSTGTAAKADISTTEARHDSPASQLSPAVAQEKRSQLDKKVVEKVAQVMVHVLGNDDTKAKTAYGRSYRFMPPFMQFAFDVRFKNYDHALTLLPSLLRSTEEKAFWEKILKQKPKNLGQAVCAEIVAQEGFPPLSTEPSAEQEAWAFEFEALALSLIPKDKLALARKPSDFDDQIAKLNSPMTADQEKVILTDDFFDRLRNGQRRDTRTLAESYKSVLKLMTYHKNINRARLLDLYKNLMASQSPLRDKYVRRIRGIGKDIRGENITARLIGSEIVGDTKDLAFVQRLLAMVKVDLQMALVTRLDYELAKCNLPAEIPPFKPTPLKKQ